jgi:hypothetical protein
MKLKKLKKKIKLNLTNLLNQQLWSWEQDDYTNYQKHIINKILNHQKIK